MFQFTPGPQSYKCDAEESKDPRTSSTIGFFFSALGDSFNLDADPIIPV